MSLDKILHNEKYACIKVSGKTETELLLDEKIHWHMIVENWAPFQYEYRLSNYRDSRCNYVTIRGLWDCLILYWSDIVLFTQRPVFHNYIAVSFSPSNNPDKVSLTAPFCRWKVINTFDCKMGYTLHSSYVRTRYVMNSVTSSQV